MLCLYTKQIIPYSDPVMSYLQRAFTVPEFQSIKQSVDFLKVISHLHVFLFISKAKIIHFFHHFRASMPSTFVKITSILRNWEK